MNRPAAILAERSFELCMQSTPQWKILLETKKKVAILVLRDLVVVFEFGDSRLLEA
jgi:hypothetical protein